MNGRPKRKNTALLTRAIPQLYLLSQILSIDYFVVISSNHTNDNHRQQRTANLGTLLMSVINDVPHQLTDETAALDLHAVSDTARRHTVTRKTDSC